MLRIIHEGNYRRKNSVFSPQNDDQILEKRKVKYLYIISDLQVLENGCSGYVFEGF